MTQRVDKERWDELRRGVKLLHDPLRNKGTAFTAEEREALGLSGLLPPRVATQEQQVARALENFRRKTSNIEKYVFLCALQDRNERLFYRILTENLDEMVPIVYTPTVGEACWNFAHLFRRSRGLYVSAEDRGRVRKLLGNWYTRDVEVIVVTDGERILGLGDLGANGMGIPIGKLALYTACAGIDPARCLPLMLDVGTNNEEFLDDALYIGIPRRRIVGGEYDELVEELVQSIAETFPRALLQFEDFARPNAFRLLDTYRSRVRCFNDDIQGTGAVALAGFLTAGRITGRPLREERFLFLGAGEAAAGTLKLLEAELIVDGLSEAEARGRCWLYDSRGLVVSSREDLEPHKRRYAQDHAPVAGVLDAVLAARPTAIIGVSGQAGLISTDVLHAMAEITERPIVFALSNPTSKSECTAEEAYRATQGRALFASGSPFPPLELGGRRFVPGQGNNAFIFPGVGLGVVASQAARVTDSMFQAAARTLAESVTDAELETGLLYPNLARIREVSASIAARVAEVAFEEGLASGERPSDLLAHVRSRMFDPHYG